MGSETGDSLDPAAPGPPAHDTEHHFLRGARWWTPTSSAPSPATCSAHSPDKRLPPRGGPRQAAGSGSSTRSATPRSRSAILRRGPSLRPVRSSDGVAVLGRIIDRLDDGWPEWRDHPHPEWGRREVAVVAWRASARAPAELPPSGGVDLLDFCSERWSRRLDSKRWVYSDLRGDALDNDRVDDYGRRGGIVMYVRDPHWGPRRPRRWTGRRRSHARPHGVLFTGDHLAWVVAMRNARTILIQLGLAAGFEFQHHQQDLSDRPSVAELLEHLESWWHPAFGSHLDVAALVADGISNLRWSDPGHDLHARPTHDRVCALLRERAMTSRPVLLA